jgi:hypothetical protein
MLLAEYPTESMNLRYKPKISPKIQSSAISEAIVGKTKKRDSSRSQTAMCCITATMNLFSFMALYISEAIRMIVSPIRDDRDTVTR